jgi:hypothetical protein
MMAVGNTHVSWLSHTSTYTTFLSTANNYFSHMLLQRWEAKIHQKESSGIELTTTRSWVRHAHHWATWAGQMCMNKYFQSQMVSMATPSVSFEHPDIRTLTLHHILMRDLIMGDQSSVDFPWFLSSTTFVLLRPHWEGYLVFILDFLHPMDVSLI